MAGFFLAVFAVGLAGVWVGALLRGTLFRSAPEVTLHPPTSLLHAGDPFPDVVLHDAAGNVLRSGDLAAGGGSVVLFIDTECPPCAQACRRWQRAVEDGIVASDRVFAISYHAPEIVEEFRAKEGLSFAFYRDVDREFLSGYAVNRFPLEVIVGASGRIRSASYDSASPVDREVVSRLLLE